MTQWLTRKLDGIEMKALVETGDTRSSQRKASMQGDLKSIQRGLDPCSLSQDISSQGSCAETVYERCRTYSETYRNSKVDLLRPRSLQLKSLCPTIAIDVTHGAYDQLINGLGGSLPLVFLPFQSLQLGHWHEGSLAPVYELDIESMFEMLNEGRDSLMQYYDEFEHRKRMIRDTVLRLVNAVDVGQLVEVVLLDADDFDWLTRRGRLLEPDDLVLKDPIKWKPIVREGAILIQRTEKVSEEQFL